MNQTVKMLDLLGSVLKHTVNMLEALGFLRIPASGLSQKNDLIGGHPKLGFLSRI